jgi:hypothetical protein
VGIGREKSVLNGVLRVSCIAQNAVCRSVQSRQATSQDVFQLLRCSRITWSFITFVTPDVCICVLHARFLNPPKARGPHIDCFVFPNFFPNFKFELLNHLRESPDSYLRAELVLSLHAS